MTADTIQRFLDNLPDAAYNYERDVFKAIALIGSRKSPATIVEIADSAGIGPKAVWRIVRRLRSRIEALGLPLEISMGKDACDRRVTGYYLTPITTKKPE